MYSYQVWVRDTSYSYSGEEQPTFQATNNDEAIKHLATLSFEEGREYALSRVHSLYASDEENAMFHRWIG